MTVATKKLLLDVREAGESILQHTAGRSFAGYSADRFFRRAVKREFEIIAEALKRIERLDPTTAARIHELRRIVDFRNRIIHGYDAVVWGVVQKHLPLLMKETADLFGAGGPAA
jgi:uncharacterized protein with HEPN domain